MTTPEEFQQFIQQMQRDAARLDRQASAFEELKSTLEALKEAAPCDPEAARRLERVNALRHDANFNALYAQAEQDLQKLNGWLGRVNGQIEQAERSGDIPRFQEPAVAEKPKNRRKKRRNFV